MFMLPPASHSRTSAVGPKARFSWISVASNVAEYLRELAIGVDNTTVMVIWPLFLVVIVFTGAGDEVYAQIGAISAITVFVGLFFVSQMYGVIN